MGDAFDLDLIKKGEDWFDIDFGWGEKGFAKRLATKLWERGLDISVLDIEDFSDEREAI